MGKYDEAWKEVIENLFEQFMYFYMPDVAEDIDFNKGFTFLDKEFQTIAGKSEDTSRELNKLVRVYLKNDEETWILVHIDVQEESKEEFAGRMFRYFYRTFDKYNKKIVSLAVFTGKSGTYQLKYDYNFYRTTLCYKYRHVKLIDYKEKHLIENKNMFALVTLAVKYSLKSKTDEKDEEMKAKFIRKLIRLMKNRRYSNEKIISLFRFIETIIEVEDKKLNQLIYEDIYELYEKEGDVMVLAKFEQKAMEKAREDIAKNMLKDNIDINAIAKYTGLTLDNIKKFLSEKESEKEK
jgi:predicted transposase/invertase (TIGR01784 family)